MGDDSGAFMDERDETTGVAAVAALAAFCGIALAIVVLLFVLVGWHLPL